MGGNNYLYPAWLAQIFDNEIQSSKDQFFVQETVVWSVLVGGKVVDDWIQREYEEYEIRLMLCKYHHAEVIDHKKRKLFHIDVIYFHIWRKKFYLANICRMSAEQHHTGFYCNINNIIDDFALIENNEANLSSLCTYHTQF